MEEMGLCPGQQHAISCDAACQSALTHPAVPCYFHIVKIVSGRHKRGPYTATYFLT